MQIQVKVNASTIVTVEAAKQKDAFKQVASAHEVFGEKRCGCCGGTNIVPAWRTVSKVTGKKIEEFEYPEYHCLGMTEDGRRCGARLSLGTINDDTGTLFPIRRLVESPTGMRPPSKADKEAGKIGAYGSHRGWHRYIPKAEDAEPMDSRGEDGGEDGGGSNGEVPF